MWYTVCMSVGNHRGEIVPFYLLVRRICAVICVVLAAESFLRRKKTVIRESNFCSRGSSISWDDFEYVVLFGYEDNFQFSHPAVTFSWSELRSEREDQRTGLTGDRTQGPPCLAPLGKCIRKSDSQVPRNYRARDASLANQQENGLRQIAAYLEHS